MEIVGLRIITETIAVNTPIRFFNHIIPCGIKNKSITSISVECNNNIEMELVKEKIINNFFFV